MATQQTFVEDSVNDAVNQPLSQPLFTEPPDYTSDDISDTDNNYYNEDNIAFQQNSQPFTYESQDYYGNKLDGNGHNNDGSKKSVKANNETLNLKKDITTQTVQNEPDVQIPITKEQSNSVENKDEVSTSCIHCVFERELDKRNYYFGNLLIGELQYIPACMRSEAYINILKYVESLKNKHRREFDEN